MLRVGQTSKSTMNQTKQKTHMHGRGENENTCDLPKMYTYVEKNKKHELKLKRGKMEEKGTNTAVKKQANRNPATDHDKFEKKNNMCKRRKKAKERQTANSRI